MLMYLALMAASLGGIAPALLSGQGTPAEAVEDPLTALEDLGGAETFLAMLEGSGLRAELEARTEPFTLLAPDDAAFSGVAPETVARLFEPASRPTLRLLLGGHILEGAVSAVDMVVAGEVVTLSGAKLPVGIVDGRVLVGGVEIHTQDVTSDGGVLHGINSIILEDPSVLEPTAERRLAAKGLALASRKGLDPLAQATILEMAVAAISELRRARGESFEAPKGGDLDSSLGAMRGALYSILGTQGPEGPGSLTPATSDMTNTKPLVNFDGSDNEPNWFTRNDDVMGGVSKSRFSLTEADAEGGARGTFRGSLSLENNGGFASVRSTSQEYDLTGFTGLQLRVKTDGREYGVSAICGDGSGRTGAWRKRFQVPAGTWTTVKIPFDDMVLNIRGRRYPDVGPPKLDAIESFSFIIADKDTSPFQIDIESISAYR